MHPSRNPIYQKPKPGSFWMAALILASMSAQAQPLSLRDAEQRAVHGDPSVESVNYRKTALSEMEVAATQLPDPMLKVGAMALPTDTFELGQEPMTQMQIGLVQKFPRGNTRALRSEQLKEQAKGLDETARDLRLRIRLAVREGYLEVMKQVKLGEINREAEAAFANLAQITEDYYATGRVPQQDVLRSAVELAKVQERALRITEMEEIARSQLVAWIDDDAWRQLDSEWPELEQPPVEQDIIDRLSDHPRIRALHQAVVAADKGVELAQQNYKPEFSVDVTYGGRAGIDASGRSRPDLLSVMVMMDLPLFTENRQDRHTAASVAESSAAAFTRDDAFRRMRSQVEMNARTLARQRERIALFESTLLPEAEFNAEATFNAYQAALEDLTTLMRARITEFDLQLEYVQLKAETQKTQARLLYLLGESS